MSGAVPFQDAQAWLREARAAVSRGWPMSVAGPLGEPVSVAHTAFGYAGFPQAAFEVELAPGVVVDAQELRVQYE